MTRQTYLEVGIDSARLGVYELFANEETDLPIGISFETFFEADAIKLIRLADGITARDFILKLKDGNDWKGSGVFHKTSSEKFPLRLEIVDLVLMNIG